MATEIYNAYLSPEDLEDDEYLPTFEHGVIESNISAELRFFLKGKNLGRVSCSSAEYRYLENESESRQPDIAFVAQERLPIRFRSYPEIAPDLAIEIVSPGDKSYDTEARISEYQQAEVRLIWIVNPFSRTIDVYRLKTGVKLQRFVTGEELSGEEVLPGFKLALNDVFDYPADPNPVPDPRSTRNRKL